MRDPAVAALPEPIRAQLNASYRALRRRGGGGPPWVVRAYVLARYRGQDVRAAMAEAHFGRGPHGPGVAEAVTSWLRGLERP